MQNTEEEPIASGTTPAATAAHTRYLSSPAATTLHRKIQGFVLRLPPQHKPHATFMQPLQCVSQHSVANLHISTHVTTSDDNNQPAIPLRSAAIGFKTRIELRTQEQPLVAEHRGETHRVRNHPSRNRRTHEVPFIAGCNHFTRKNAMFRAPASSANPTSPLMKSLTPKSHTKVSHQSLTPPCIFCILMSCKVSHQSLTPPFIECIVTGKSHP